MLWTFLQACCVFLRTLCVFLGEKYYSTASYHRQATHVIAHILGTRTPRGSKDQADRQMEGNMEGDYSQL